VSIHDARRRARGHVGPEVGLLSNLSNRQLADLLAPVRVSSYVGGSKVLLRWCDYRKGVVGAQG
jgi:hypothetical protein